MKVSLVVCTRNRAEQLRTTLDRMARLRDENWELIVVDNGSTDATSEVLRAFRGRLGGPLVLLHEPRPGLGIARNTGFRATSGEIVAFTDDDCYPAEDYLQRIRECFAQSRADLGYVGGRILLHDPTDYPITIQEQTTTLTFEPRSFVPAGIIHGANMAFRRIALDAVGGFDSALGAGTPFPCEDVEVLGRLSGAGWRGAYDPRPVVRHHHGRKTAEEAAALMRQYYRARGAYYAKSLLNPTLRLAYLRAWFHSAMTASARTTAREVRGALAFFRSATFAQTPET